MLQKESVCSESLSDKIFLLTEENNLLQNKLDKLVKETEQFTYMVSHDVKAPLRAIENIVTWIEEDLEKVDLSDDIKENMSLLKNRIARMSGLFDGLTEYSRALNNTEGKESINLNTMVLQIMDEINTVPAFECRIEKNLPTLNAEKIKLQKVFRHLMHNSIIHHHSKPGIISISFKDLEDCFQFTITDDGPGIHPDHFEKVFVMFSTLQSRDKFETAGTGLAIAKRIVESLNQKIWITSENGAGTSMHFTWEKC